MLYRLSLDASCLLKRLCISTAIRVTALCTWGGYNILLRLLLVAEGFTKTLVSRRQCEMHFPITVLSCNLSAFSTTTTIGDCLFVRMDRSESWVPKQQKSTSKVLMVCQHYEFPSCLSNNLIRVVDQRCNCQRQPSKASSRNRTCIWCARRPG